MNYPPMKRMGGVRERNVQNEESGRWSKYVKVYVHQKDISHRETKKKERNWKSNQIVRAKLEGNKEMRTQAYKVTGKRWKWKEYEKDKEIKMPQPIAQKIRPKSKSEHNNHE